MRQYHFLELARSHAERLLLTLYEHDIPLRYLFFEVEDMDVLPFLDKFLRNKTYSEIGGDHRQYLICSECLDIRMIIQPVAGEKSGIKLKGFCIRTE